MILALAVSIGVGLIIASAVTATCLVEHCKKKKKTVENETTRGPNVNNLKEEILYNWPSSDNTLVRRHVIQNEYYEVDSKVKSKFTSHQVGPQRSTRISEDSAIFRPS